MKKKYSYLYSVLIFISSSCALCMEENNNPNELKKIVDPSDKNQNNQPAIQMFHKKNSNWSDWFTLQFDPTIPEEERTKIQQACRYVWTNYTKEGKNHLIGLDRNGQDETKKIFTQLKKQMEKGEENPETTHKTNRRIEATRQRAQRLCSKLSKAPYERQDILDAVALIQLRHEDALTEDLKKELARKAHNAIITLTNELETNLKILNELVIRDEKIEK